MTTRDCYFETDRLLVDDWSRFLTGETAEELRSAFVVSLLTEAVTRDLPPGWQGRYNIDRAFSWFAERQSESTVLLVADRSDDRPVGLLILSESGDGDDLSDIRLGYILDEAAWGRGLATELVGGFAGWCRRNGTVRRVVAGVADGRGASARVLQKNGFVPHITSNDHAADEVEYRLMLPT